MKVFDIETGSNYLQEISVVDYSMAKTDSIFIAKYCNTTIELFKLQSKYMQVQDIDEQAKAIK